MAFPAWHSQPGVHGAGTAMDEKQAVGAVITAPCRKPFISRPASYPVIAAHTRSRSVERSLESLGSPGDAMVTSLLFLPACLIVRFSGRRKTPEKGVEVKRGSEGGAVINQAWQRGLRRTACLCSGRERTRYSVS